MHEPDAAEIIRDRATELLEHSTSGVEAELERARGWLESSHFRVVPNYWEVNAVAGALGSLANVWGRLNFWARGTGAYERIATELEESMNELVRLRAHLLQQQP